MNLLTREKRASRFSATAYFWFAALLAFGGLAASFYLARSHYRNFTDVGYQSFCAISRSLNCDTVSQSPHAIFLGAPLAVWGALGYILFLFLIAIFRSHKNQGWATLFVLAAVFSSISIYLGIVSSLFIRSYCLMCIVTYGINFVLLLCSWLALRRFGGGTWIDRFKNDLAVYKANSGRVILAGGTFLLIIASIALFYPKYWHFQNLTMTADMNSGVTEDGSPWIGATDPTLTITEFSDYMCFQCGKMHSHLRQLVNRYPGKIRLVHRHFPLDNEVNPIVHETVHPNAGVISLFAIVAQEAGKFWPVNDLLFRQAREEGSINISQIAKQSDVDISNFQAMINDKRILTHLMKDIQAAWKLGISATPSYEIDGKVYHGTIPSEILDRALKDD